MYRTLCLGIFIWGVLLSQGPLLAQTAKETPSIGPSDEYLLGPKDIVTITVYGEPTLSGDYEISESGVIRFPLLNTVKIGGLTRQAAAEKIEKLLEKDYFVDVQLSLAIKEFRSYSVNVMGEIKNPGKKYLRSSMTLLDLLSDAGGLTGEAGEYIILQRLEKDGPLEKTAVYQIKLDDLSAGTGLFGHFRIMPGDIVTINPKAYFYIQGEVAHPGKYEIGKDLTILKAIALAGGFGKFADEKDVELHRVITGEKQIIKLNIRDIRKQKAEDIYLISSDTIIVNKRIF